MITRFLALRPLLPVIGNLVSARVPGGLLRYTERISWIREYGSEASEIATDSSKTSPNHTDNHVITNMSKRGPESGESPSARKKVDSTTTKASIAKIFKLASEKATTAAPPDPSGLTWRLLAPKDDAETSLLATEHLPPGYSAFPKVEKVAAFDLDSTLIEVGSGKKFAANGDDWRWWDPSVCRKVAEVVKNGYAVVIFSNQGGLVLHPKVKPGAKPPRFDRVAEYKKKVTKVLRELGVPVRLYAATAKDRFRKPGTGMWGQFLEDAGVKSADVDMSQSFFVGDAAGRPARKGRSKDFSCSDRNMAFNLGIRFQTPEEFFRGEDPEPFERDFDPAGVEVVGEDAPPLIWDKKAEDIQEMVVFCGRPGAGKSSLWWGTFELLGFRRVNQDILGSRDKCIAKARELLKEGHSVVIDNTNRDKKTRAYWVEVAKEHGIVPRLVYLKTSKTICMHNDAHRSSHPGSAYNPEKREVLPNIAFSSFEKAFEEPTLDEGFEEIVELEFKFRGSQEDFAAWNKFYS